MSRKPWSPEFDKQNFTYLARDDHINKTLENYWHQYILKLYDEIQDIGEYATNNEAIKLFCDEFKLVHPVTKKAPKVIKNVFYIIEDKDWYDSCPQGARNSIYMIMYGMFRTCFVIWIIDAANLWFKNRKITTYETKKLRASKILFTML